MTALVTGSHFAPCPHCLKRAGFIELRLGDAQWTRIEPHSCPFAATTLRGPGLALADLVDEFEEVPLGV